MSSPLRLPYPGLRSFRREESDIFFGREDCINGMVDRLAATRFLAVLGSSGTGKSSVVKTGLLDALDLGLMAPAGSTWYVADFRPGGAPLNNLSVRLLEMTSNGSTNALANAEVDLLRAFLGRGPRSLVQWCEDRHLENKTNILLLVDQFEELFRYDDYARREEAEGFAALLIESTQQRKFPIYVALTMRSEYLGACSLIDSLAEAISAGMVLIPRMLRERCRSAIVGPAAVCGFKIEDALVNRILNDLAAFAPWDNRSDRDQLDRLARRADQLPLLQYCLNRMWIRARGDMDTEAISLSISDYERIGGLSGALDAHAQELLRTLDDRDRRTAETVFRALTDGASVSDAVRRPMPFRELVEACGAEEVSVRKVVDTFRAPGCNFLSPELDPNLKPLSNNDIIDISHESLIRQWKQLAEWVEAEERVKRQWRRLMDRYEDGELVQGMELVNMVSWRDARNPTAAWARRYGGDFQGMMQLLELSEKVAKRQTRKFAPIMLPLLSLAVFCTGLVSFALIQQQFIQAAGEAGDSVVWVAWRLPRFLAYLPLVLQTAVQSVVCAVALWRYGDLLLSRAIFSGIVILVLTLGIGLAFQIITMSWGVDAETALFWWNLTLSGPLLVTLLMIFCPSLRYLSTWVFLVLFYSTGVVILLKLEPAYLSIGLISSWCAWCVALGFQLRGLDGVDLPSKHPALYTALQLIAVFAGMLVVAGGWEVVATDVIFPNKKEVWSWAIFASELPICFAVTFAFSFYRHLRLQPRLALAAGAAIFLLGSVTAIILATILESFGISKGEVAFSAGAVSGPLGLLILAILDRTFRQGWTWVLLSLSYVIPCVALAMLQNTDRMELGPSNLLICAISVVWIGAVGFLIRTPKSVFPLRPQLKKEAIQF
jgi:hypothetical protein